MEMQRRMLPMGTSFETREDGDNLTIEGYFAVFNSIYDMGNGMTESIAPGAFDGTISDDVRALVNHDSTLVLGRTSAHTLEIRQDEHGLWGKVTINPNDGDAMNLYARVKRGDVNQCSFGFDILDEETEYRSEGEVHWTIKAVKLYEISAVTFPAYQETAISARQHDLEEIKKREAEAKAEKSRSWKEKMIKRLKGGLDNGAQSINSEEEA